MTDGEKILREHQEAHEQTLKALRETDTVLADAQRVLSEARIKLQHATDKYQERLYGPEHP